MLDAMLTGLLQASDAAQDPHDYELSLVSDEDLARRLRQEILDLVRDDPRLAIAAAKDLGWTVVPPDEEPS